MTKTEQKKLMTQFLPTIDVHQKPRVNSSLEDVAFQKYVSGPLDNAILDIVIDNQLMKWIAPGE